MKASDAPIRLERPEAGIAVLTLCRERGPNVVSAAFCERLLQCCETISGWDALHAVVVRAEGPAFCVGADLAQMHAHIDDLADHVATLIEAAHTALMALKRLPVPVIACVRGVAAGGGLSLALACDQVLAARSARFVVAYPQLGTTPDMGLSHSLSALLGPRRALEHFLAPGALDAEAARKLGLVSHVFDDDALDGAALAAARQWAALPRMAVLGAKSLFAADSAQAMERQMGLEKEWFSRCAATPEFRLRVEAFLGVHAGASSRAEPE